MKRICLATAMSILAVATTTGFATSTATAGLKGIEVTHICRQYGHARVDSGRYVFRNDDWQNRGECLTNHDNSANFTVTKSGANGYNGLHPLVQAYPYIFTGWSWGVSSSHTVLPARVRRINPVVTMDTTEHAPGRWNASLDLWFSSHPLHNGQALGAELMIWQNTRFIAHWQTRQIVNIDGTDWYYKDWTTRHANGLSWPLIIYWRVHPTWHLRNLAIKPFLRHSRNLIKPKWYVLNIEAGFEIWTKGTGLDVTRFRVRMHKRRIHRRHKGYRCPGRPRKGTSNSRIHICG